MSISLKKMALSKVLLCVALLASSVLCGEIKTLIPADFDPNPQYSFSYGVEDVSTGDIKNHQEERNGDLVRGSYSLVDADGFRRIVEYSSDPATGFVANVRREVFDGKILHGGKITKVIPQEQLVAKFHQPLYSVSAHSPINLQKVVTAQVTAPKILQTPFLINHAGAAPPTLTQSILQSPIHTIPAIQKVVSPGKIQLQGSTISHVNHLTHPAPIAYKKQIITPGSAIIQNPSATIIQNPPTIIQNPTFTTTKVATVPVQHTLPAPSTIGYSNTFYH